MFGENQNNKRNSDHSIKETTQPQRNQIKRWRFGKFKTYHQTCVTKKGPTINPFHPTRPIPTYPMKWTEQHLAGGGQSHINEFFSKLLGRQKKKTNPIPMPVIFLHLAFLLLLLTPH